jgi:hypothetical protein
MMAIIARPHGGLPCFSVETFLAFGLNGAPPAATAEGATRFGCLGFALGMGAGVGFVAVAVSHRGRANICPQTTARLGFVATAKTLQGQLRGWQKREASGGVAKPLDMAPEIHHRRKRRERGCAGQRFQPIVTLHALRGKFGTRACKKFYACTT